MDNRGVGSQACQLEGYNSSLTIVGAFELVSMSGLPDMASLHVFGYSVPSEPLYLGLLCCCVFVAIIMLYRPSSRSQQLAVSTLCQAVRRGKTSHEQPDHSCKV